MARTSGARHLEIVGLRDFVRDLKDVDAALPKALREGLKRVAEQGAVLARAKAQALGGVHAKAAPAIKPYATQKSASIGVPGRSKRYPMAAVAFWGAKRRTGWYAKERYSDSTPQHPEWIGQNWEPASRSEGPYAINAALAEYASDVPRAVIAEIEAVTRRAFPQGG